MLLCPALVCDMNSWVWEKRCLHQTHPVFTSLYQWLLTMSVVKYYIIKSIASNQNGWNKQTTAAKSEVLTKLREWEKEIDWLVLPQRQAHVLLHLLQAVIVGVDEVKRQRSGQRAASSSWRDTQKPAHTGQTCIQRRNELYNMQSGIKKANTNPIEDMMNTKANVTPWASWKGCVVKEERNTVRTIR